MKKRSDTRTSSDELSIRRCRKQDLPAVAKLAGGLVRMHHAVDPARFMKIDRVEEGYAWWLGREMKRAKAVVLVAEKASAILGYSYGTFDGRDWNMLLDAHGAIHDVFVREDARQGGVGKRLVEAMIAELEKLGAVRVVLSTMVGNKNAQRLFAHCGFRPTMIEMTRG